MLELRAIINVVEFEFEWARMILEKLSLNNNDDRRDENKGLPFSKMDREILLFYMFKYNGI